eukprot:GHVU01038782.1.p1 GENE.GHVU01038782.1~~GHVU01038782.1.p1  ORF type:complete len:144 (+),score=10.37 GHVU01038782.1:240-671(+)
MIRLMCCCLILVVARGFYRVLFAAFPAKNVKITFERPTRIILACQQLKVEQTSTWQTQVTCQQEQNFVVLDSGYTGYRYYPINLSLYGIVYTRDGCSHVVVGSPRRTKVTARSLPCRTCNKFENADGKMGMSRRWALASFYLT